MQKEEEGEEKKKREDNETIKVRHMVLESTLKEMRDTTEGIDPCVICLETVSERAIASPCRHLFDFLCLVTWLQQRATCPLCL